MDEGPVFGHRAVDRIVGFPLALGLFLFVVGHVALQLLKNRLHRQGSP